MDGDLRLVCVLDRRWKVECDDDGDGGVVNDGVEGGG